MLSTCTYITQSWQRFLHDDYQLFIVHKDAKDTIEITSHITSDCTFLNHLHALTRCVSFTDKMDYFQHNHVDIHDLLDLLDHNIFEDHEYQPFFQTLHNEEHALLIKLILSDACAFHRQASLSSLMDELAPDQAWMVAWKQSVCEKTPAEQTAIVHLVNKLRILS